jgi:hypothetical protein
MPFGKHQDQPLSEVPTPYLSWLIAQNNIARGLRDRLNNELRGRGVDVPVQPPAPRRRCFRCHSTQILANWHQWRNGSRHVRGTCARCGAWCGTLPQTEANIAEANRNASPTPVITALVELEALGVELVSDGNSVSYVGDGWRKVPRELDAIVRQCSHTLARMIGDNRPRQ